LKHGGTEAAEENQTGRNGKKIFAGAIDAKIVVRKVIFS
jgi:hypothetical protein